jgi:hypothetical protein
MHNKLTGKAILAAEIVSGMVVSDQLAPIDFFFGGFVREIQESIYMLIVFLKDTYGDRDLNQRSLWLYNLKISLIYIIYIYIYI